MTIQVRRDVGSGVVRFTGDGERAREGMELVAIAISRGEHPES